MFNILKNLKYVKLILIIVGIILFLCAVSFILTWWKLIVFIAFVYFSYITYKSIK